MFEELEEDGTFSRRGSGSICSGCQGGVLRRRVDIDLTLNLGLNLGLGLEGILRSGSRMTDRGGVSVTFQVTDFVSARVQFSTWS